MSGSPEISQSGRLLGITSPLGPDVLILRHLSVTEAIGRPFVIEAEVLSANDGLAPKDLLGKSVTCTIALGTQPARQFNGMVRAFAKVAGHERDLTAYRLEAVPLLWNMTRTADCRIFQEQSVQDICRRSSARRASPRCASARCPPPPAPTACSSTRPISTSPAG
jgi:type VI secretion system secreted protein VgrG